MVECKCLIPQCPRRLAWPRTSPFHGGNTGSNPVGDANLSHQCLRGECPPMTIYSRRQRGHFLQFFLQSPLRTDIEQNERKSARPALKGASTSTSRTHPTGIPVFRTATPLHPYSV